MINLLISDPVWPLLVLWVKVQIAASLYVALRWVTRPRKQACLTPVLTPELVMSMPQSTLVSFSIEIDFNRAKFYGVRDGNTLHLSDCSAYFATGTAVIPDDWTINELKINM